MVPHARIGHKVPGARLTWRYFGRRCYAEGQSKALISRLAQKRDALGTERSYVLRTLSSGVAKGLFDTFLRLDPGGVGRAAAIVFGLGMASLGYAVRSLKRSPEEPEALAGIHAGE
jgi:hypothetical protein